jgi:membrane protease YdiL (CAAX protease family)
MDVHVEGKLTPFSESARPWLFLGLTWGLTWVFEFLAAVFYDCLPGWGVTMLHYLGGLMPLAVALGLAYTVHDRLFQRDFWRRMIDVKRIGGVWYAVIFLYAPLRSGLAALIDIAVGGSGIAPEGVSRLIEQPLLILPTLLFWLLFGPVPEEPGWRGYALDGLQARRTALSSSLIVGVVWSTWHMPLFFIPGTWQAADVGLGTQHFWFYMFTIVFEAVLYTWIYNHTGRSILAVILFHFTGNAFGELFALSAGAEVYNFILSSLAVLLVVLIWGPKTLTGKRDRLRESEPC